MAASDYRPKTIAPGVVSDYLSRTAQPVIGASAFKPGAVQPKADLTTSAGLYEAARQMGLREQADKVLSEKGEKAKTFYSGGFVSDIFDSLNALQYGIVGLIKGKSFKEGVKTRQSFSDKDALGDFGIPGTIAGVALDIAVDPLTYITPWTIAKKIPGITKGAKAIKSTVRATKAGKWFGSRLVYRFGQDPVYKLADSRRIKNISVGTRNLMDMAKGVDDIPDKLARKLLTRDKTGRFIRTPLSKLKGVLKDDDLFKAARAYAVQDDLSRQGAKLISSLGKETVESNMGKYLRNAYEEYELGRKAGMFGTSKIGIKGIKKRVAKLTPAQMKKLGQIDNPAYLLFKGTFDLAKDIENAKLFGAVSKQFAVKTAKEGFQQLPNTARLGELAGKFVPKNIFDSIQEITKVAGPTEKALKKVVAGFKFGKVVMNPATQARNVVSNTLLNWWKLGLGPWRLDSYADAAKSWLKHDDLFKRALHQAGDFHTYAREEMM
ncbi:MAG: hypothetical protein U9O94_02765, partial [Nanoarchaeota archaeon]|nr:hypothetical protein [Nanoarchaeota archaeon]